MVQFCAKVMFAITGILMGGAAMTEFDTPENAVRALEEAFKSRDIEAAVHAKDFDAEARLMLQRINPDMARDPEIVKQTAEVLKLGFRKEIEIDGFPDFTGLSCSLAKPIEVGENLVKIVETCRDVSGAKSTHILHAFKGAKGWRVVVVATE